MLLSIILAWFSVVIAVLSAAKYIIRKYASKHLNRAFSRGHIKVGTLLLATGFLHGLFAGNAAWAGLSDTVIAPVLFTWNWGTACFITAVLLAMSYLLRKSFRKHWMTAHRVLTVLLVVLIVIHVASVGIKLDDRLKSLLEPDRSEEITASADTVISGDSIDSGTVYGENAANAQDDSENTSAQQDSVSKVIEDTNKIFSGAQLKDGTYKGSASGLNGIITVSVQVSGAQVTNITVLSESDTSQYFSRAKTILSTIITKQSLEVDAVSGATFSSAGLVNAVFNALEDAVVSGNLELAQFNVK